MHLAAEHVEEISREDAERSATDRAKARRSDLLRQSIEDLESLLADAAVRIGLSVGDTGFSWETASVPIIESPFATLEVHGLTPVDFQDPALAFGEIVVGNRRGARGQSLGSITFEEVEEGRHGWILYRLRKQAAVLNYRLGPSDREHGLSVAPFFGRRQDILRGATGSFSVRKLTLTVALIEDLYGEAMALPAPPLPDVP
jgi:hypothetical protein